MGKRMVSLIMVIVLTVTMSSSMVIKAKAVVPAGLIASALYSYVASSGIRLFRDSTDLTNVEQLEDDIMDLWSKYTNDSFSALGEGISVSGGKFIFDYVILPQVQGFVNWISSNYNLIPNQVVPLSEGGIGSVGTYDFTYNGDVVLPGYANGVWAMPVQAGGPPITITYGNGNVRNYYFDGNCVVFNARLNTDNGSTVTLTCVSTSPFTVEYIEEDTNGDLVASGNGNVYQGNVSYGGIRTDYYIFEVNSSSRNQIEPILPVNYFSASQYLAMNEMIWVIFNGSVVEEDGLFASVASSVLDLTYDLAKDKSQGLSVDIGIGANATDEEMISAVADSFIGAESVEGVRPVATPIPIEGVSELYPQVPVTDVDNLGLPDLGQALTTRFPFCIPFDVVELVKSLNAAPARPVFDIDVIPQSLKQKIGITADTSFTLDFGDQKYSLMIKLIRWGVLFGFILMLALQTKRLIWTTGA